MAIMIHGKYGYESPDCMWKHVYYGMIYRYRREALSLSGTLSNPSNCSHVLVGAFFMSEALLRIMWLICVKLSVL